MNEQRQLLVSETQSKFVSPDEFLKLMVSRYTFIRQDEPDLNLLGLLDEQTGVRVLVKEEDLARVRNAYLQLN